MHQIHTKYTKEFKCYVINQQWKKYMNEYMYGQGIDSMGECTHGLIRGCVAAIITSNAVPTTCGLSLSRNITSPGRQP